MVYIKNLFYFYFSPTKETVSSLPLCSKIINIFSFLLLQYLFILLITGIRILLQIKGILEPLKYDGEMNTLTNSLFLSVLLGPLLEEIVFRLWLIYDKINISISVAYILLWVSAKVFGVHWFSSIPYVLIFVLVFISIFTALFFLLKRYENQKIISFWEKNQKLFIIISCIFFGAIHIGNYTTNNNSIIYYFITFAPQIFFGFILCYIRIRMGFGASVATHSINNFIPLILSKII
ncbi:CAAX prenyl protease-like protein [Chryseobacterium sp. 7]|uniref:CPBP family glutamic-type intramembrane protease n=1 Tax=Chryseobacterium sp. 7 TaxID=2035214 RepID=UPI000EB1E115|nr:CPBP family glutamic-type intramembrane protease [Chryseobacterium sp. 7]RLJ33459.1 CAAX prenyl protease-like protein [Chryseobacterium sp. 7]